ncbi:GNAT family N-acetyltransferase [Nisaea sp.]|uniref:GNAT family N-acetyltransferase n=1 Tax=Nisaea sp. TaxID=2024842 RepID=UPI00326478CC
MTSDRTGNVFFRGAEPSDTGAIQNWVMAPHVTRWSHKVFSRIGAALQGPQNSTETQLLIAVIDGRSVGCAYVYSAHGDPSWSAIPDVTPHTRAIDFLIGESDVLNRKWGQAMLRALGLQVFEDPGIDRIVACPLADNWPAVIALKRVGFREKGRHPNPAMNAMYLTVTPATLKS